MYIDIYTRTLDNSNFICANELNIFSHICV